MIFFLKIQIILKKKFLKTNTMEISGKPIPFIEIIDSVDENGPSTRFEVNSEAISFLAGLKNRQVFSKNNKKPIKY